MEEIKTGGPAFPTVVDMAPELHEGMTLRDYFAAKAPVDFGVAVAVWGENRLALDEDRTRAVFLTVWAMIRYEWADAMLAARKGGVK